MNTQTTNNTFDLINAEPTINAEKLVIAMTGNTLYAGFDAETVTAWSPKEIFVPFWNTDTERMNVTRARGVASAMMKLMTGNVKVGLGFYIYGTELTLGEEVKTVGYVIGARLLTLVPDVEIIGGRALSNSTVYRLSWASWGYRAQPVEYIHFESGEGDEAKHARRVLRLFEGFRLLFAAFSGKRRIKLAWKTEPTSHNDNYQPLVDYVMSMYEAWTDGETEKVQEMHAVGIAKSQDWARTGENIRKESRGVELTAEYLTEHNTGAHIDIDEELVGRTFQTYRGSLPILKVTFRENTWRAQANALAGSRTVVEIK